MNTPTVGNSDVDIDATKSEFECKLCCLTPRPPNAIFISCQSGHTFCRTCIRKLKESGHTCPDCRQPLLEHPIKDLYANRMIADFCLANEPPPPPPPPPPAPAAPPRRVVLDDDDDSEPEEPVEPPSPVNPCVATSNAAPAAASGVGPIRQRFSNRRYDHNVRKRDVAELRRSLGRLIDYKMAREQAEYGGAQQASSRFHRQVERMVREIGDLQLRFHRRYRAHYVPRDHATRTHFNSIVNRLPQNANLLSLRFPV